MRYVSTRLIKRIIVDDHDHPIGSQSWTQEPICRERQKTWIFFRRAPSPGAGCSAWKRRPRSPCCVLPRFRCVPCPQHTSVVITITEIFIFFDRNSHCGAMVCVTNTAYSNSSYHPRETSSRHLTRGWSHRILGNCQGAIVSSCIDYRHFYDG
jgi:hypothetical protein